MREYEQVKPLMREYEQVKPLHGIHVTLNNQLTTKLRFMYDILFVCQGQNYNVLLRL